MNTMLNQVGQRRLGPAERVGLEQCHRGARGGVILVDPGIDGPELNQLR